MPYNKSLRDKDVKVGFSFEVFVAAITLDI